MEIDRVGVQTAVAAGGTEVVEVLDAEEFRWAHLPGAVHVPLEDIGRRLPDVIDATGPVIVYCNDFL